MKIRFKISKFSLSVDKHFNAMLTVKSWRPLYNHFIRIGSIVVGRMNDNWVRLIIVFCRRSYDLQKKQGFSGLVKYLKVMSVVIQQVIGGHKERDLTLLGPRISRTKGGLPRFLPVQFRDGIRRRDPKFVKMALTLCSVFRLITFSSPLKTKTITDPFKGDPLFLSKYDVYINLFRERFFKCDHIRTPETLESPTPFVIQTSSPNSYGDAAQFSTHPFSLFRSMIALLRYPDILRSIYWIAEHSKNSSSFFRLLEVFVKTILKTIRIETYHLPIGGLEMIRERLKIVKDFPFLWNLGEAFLYKGKNIWFKTFNIGKLSLKEEAAGKIRVFAMVDPYTQWVLRPLHRFLFNSLRPIKMDGTFNQLEPLKRVPFGKVPIYSYDLSAATDRLPIQVQIKIIASLFGEEYATHWANILVGRPYSLRSADHNVFTELNYAVGQPMGALSSWAMLAVTHHFIIQCAAWSTGVVSHRVLFRDYAVLGDDMVIWNKTVADQYLYIMKGMGVEIGLAKSLLSTSGLALEFAKKTFMDGKDVSPIPLKEYSAALAKSSAFIEFVKKYTISDNNVKKLLGLGYKSTAKAMRWRMYQLLLKIPTT